MTGTKLGLSGRRPLVALIGLLLVFSALAAPAPASGPATHEAVSDLPDEPAPTVGDGISPAEMEDLRTIAEQSGMSLSAAIERYAWNDNFALAVDQIRDSVPDAFTTAKIIDADTAWIGFAAETPAAALSVLDEFRRHFAEVQVEVRPHLGFSELQLVDAMAAAYLAVLHAPGVADATATYSYETEEMTITVAFDGEGGGPSTSWLGQVAQDSLNKSSASHVAEAMNVAVISANAQSLFGNTSGTHHHGGETLSTCTSGFGTRDTSSTSGSRGISTAGHCPLGQSDDGSSLTFQEEHDGAQGDYEWHTGPDTHTDDFYSGSTTSTEANRRDVSGKANPVTGQSLCRNGKTSYKDCQEVRDHLVCAAGSCWYAQFEDFLADLGDSGGPVFWGNTAYGINKGWMYDLWPIKREIFSRATRMSLVIDAWVATS